MNMKTQNARFALGELEEDAKYQAFSDEALDDRFHSFRQGVEITGIRCLELYPDAASPEEIAERLGQLRTQCTGQLKPFRQYIERAQAAVAG